jgi:hypothetical protein
MKLVDSPKYEQPVCEGAANQERVSRTESQFFMGKGVREWVSAMANAIWLMIRTPSSVEMSVISVSLRRPS